jgi:hypothetical protein
LRSTKNEAKPTKPTKTKKLHLKQNSPPVHRGSPRRGRGLIRELKLRLIASKEVAEGNVPQNVRVFE